MNGMGEWEGRDKKREKQWVKEVVGRMKVREERMGRGEEEGRGVEGGRKGVGRKREKGE